jgi:hypothetical protein
MSEGNVAIWAFSTQNGVKNKYNFRVAFLYKIYFRFLLYKLTLHKMIKVLYLETSMWEYDFIINDVLYNIEKEVEFYNPNNFNLLLERTDIIEKNILIINQIQNFNNIINVVDHIKPAVIFYLSDEYGNESYSTILQNKTKILFRQYNHLNYNYSHNNRQIPLGYSKYFLDNKRSCSVLHQFSFNMPPSGAEMNELDASSMRKDINEREINVSFIGSDKSDRRYMANVFKENMKNSNIIFVNNNWNIDNLPISPGDCFNIYNNSIFVLCGRGNKSLDSFRIYEAIVAGAIPVICGPMDEIKNTFFYNNKLPPFICDETWEKVLTKCNDLLNNYEMLQQIQNELMSWWNDQMSTMNNLILDSLHS